MKKESGIHSRKCIRNVIICEKETDNNNVFLHGWKLLTSVQNNDNVFLLFEGGRLAKWT